MNYNLKKKSSQFIGPVLPIKIEFLTKTTSHSMQSINESQTLDGMMKKNVLLLRFVFT